MRLSLKTVILIIGVQIHHFVRFQIISELLTYRPIFIMALFFKRLLALLFEIGSNLFMGSMTEVQLLQAL
jgi:hypothetical protein